LVTYYGGKYMQQLSRKVTHLLCDKATGRKYVTALAWGIHIVTTSWLFDSINAKGTVDVSRYDVPPDLDGGMGDNALYLRSGYSRSNPYGALSSARSRLGVSAPILIRRHRNPIGANYTPLFSLPATHPHQFAQTTQIQGGSLPLSHSTLRHQAPLAFKSSSSRSRDKEGRTNMDRYRDMIDQVSGLVKMCDDIIGKSATILQNSDTLISTGIDNNNNNNSSTTNNNNNNSNNNGNTNNNNNNNNFLNLANFSNILSTSITSNISALYNDLNNLCNSNPLQDNTPSSKPSTTTENSTTTQNDESSLALSCDSKNSTQSGTSMPPSTAMGPSQTVSTNDETSTDAEVDSEDEPGTATAPSEQEK